MSAVLLANSLVSFAATAAGGDMHSNETMEFDTFCGADGFQFYLTKDGRFKLFSDCAREIFTGALVHGIFLLIGWFRMVKLWDEPKIPGGVIQGFWHNKNVRWYLRFFTVVKFVCLAMCTLFVDAKVVLSLIMDTSDPKHMPTVYFLVDSIKMLSWLLCDMLIYMEFTRNKAHWIGIRLFWIASFIVGCIRQTEFVPTLLDKSFDLLDYGAIVYQIVFVCNFFLAIIGSLGFCLRRVIEQFKDVDMEIILRKYKIDKIRIKFNDILLLIRYGWYFLLPGVVFAIIQGYTVIELQEKGAEVLSAVKKSRVEVDEILFYYVMWVPVGAIATIGQMICLGIGGEIILARVRNKLFSSLANQDMTFFNEVGTGYLISRLITDTDIMGVALTVQLSLIIPSLVEFITGVMKLFRASWRLSLLMNGLLFVTFIITTVRSQLITQRYSAKYSDTRAVSTKKATECIFGYPTVRTFGKDKAECEAFGRLVGITAKVGTIKEILEGIFEGVEMFLNSAIIGLGLWYGSTLVFAKVIDDRELDVFTVVGIGTIRAFLQVVRVAPEFYRASSSAARVFELINKKPRMDIHAGIEINEDDFKAHIEFQNVTFSYDAPPDPNKGADLNVGSAIVEEKAAIQVLSNFSLDIPSGQTIALVGSSGSGKSTVLQLAMRFYDVKPENGKILLDGVDYREIKPKWLLEQMGVVSQMPTLFDGSIEENVKYSCKTVEQYFNEERFWESVDMANARAVLESHDEREKFIVGEGGENLSGGQRQRISIARAIRKQPKILILDEVTSALDPEAEQQVMVGLKNLMKGRTCLVVAHRLHTIIDVDKIVVMHKGKIVEQGKHDALMALKGTYFDLFSKQQVLSQMQMETATKQGDLDDKQVFKTTVSRLVGSLKSYHCFDNEEIQELVARLSKHMNLDKEEERAVFQIGRQQEALNYADSGDDILLPDISIFNQATVQQPNQDLQAPLLGTDNSRDPTV